jgi:hypothetical protein
MILYIHADNKDHMGNIGERAITTLVLQTKDKIYGVKR